MEFRVSDDGERKCYFTNQYNSTQKVVRSTSTKQNELEILNTENNLFSEAAQSKISVNQL